MSQTHDVHRASRRRELHQKATAAGATSPASLALGLTALEGEGWRVERVDRDGDRTTVTVDKVVRPTPRDEVAARIRVDRARGRSLRAIARELERDGIPAPRGGLSWSATTVQRVGEH